MTPLMLEAGTGGPNLQVALAAEREKEAILAEIEPFHRRAQQGDPETLAILRAGLPESIWCKVGDLADLAETALVSRVAGSNALLREALPRKLEAFRSELAGAAPSPLERLLVQRVVLAWLDLYGTEWVAARRDPPSEADSRRVSQAQRRYLAAIRTLAAVRRLQIPTVMQINVADRQLNVAGHVAGVERPRRHARRGTTPQRKIE